MRVVAIFGSFFFSGINLGFGSCNPCQAMHSSAGRKRAWDCSEDEMVSEAEWDPDPLAEMPPPETEDLPPEEELNPEANQQSPATPEPSTHTEPTASDAAASPELPLSVSTVEVESTTDSPQSSSQGCDRLRLIAPPPTKRRRLSDKTTVSRLICPPPQKPSAQLELPSEHKEEFVTKYFWNKLNATQQYNFVYEKVRSFYVRKVHENSLKGEALASFRELAGNVRQQQGRQAFKVMGADEKRAITRRWAELCEPPPYIDKQAKDMFQSGDGAHHSRRQGRLKTSSALFTWMLPEGFVDMTGVLDEGESTTSLKQVVERLRQSLSVKKAWEKLLDHGRQCMQMAGAEDVAMCLEVCPETLELQKIVRLHVHALIRSNSQLLAVQHLWKFDLEEVPVHLSTGIKGVSCTRGRAQWSGFLYCCLKEKKGTVLAEATKQPFTGFLVNPQWIMNLVQADKLEIGPAHDLLVKCVNGSRHIKELQAYDQEMEKIAVKQAVAEAGQLLGGTLKEQKHYPKVQAFINQFKKPRHRYMFLVLAGPSRVGKTAFARSLCGPGMETLELNCSSGAEPDLKAYRFRRHEVLLFDEIEAEQVAAQRKLFQAQAAPVQLACSSTNCFSYEVFVWRKKFVLASNNWNSSLDKLQAADRAWIIANSIVLEVNEAMYFE